MENFTEWPAGYEAPIYQEALKLAEYSKLSREEQMAYQSSINATRDYNATIRYAEKKGLEKGRQLEREIAEKEISRLSAKAESEIQKAYADKLESARSFKKIGALTSQQIADSLNLPLEVVEKL